MNKIIKMLMILMSFISFELSAQELDLSNYKDDYTVMHYQTQKNRKSHMNFYFFLLQRKDGKDFPKELEKMKFTLMDGQKPVEDFMLKFFPDRGRGLSWHIPLKESKQVSEENGKPSYVVILRLSYIIDEKIKEKSIRVGTDTNYQTYHFDQKELPVNEAPSSHTKNEKNTKQFKAPLKYESLFPSKDGIKASEDKKEPSSDETKQ